MLRLRNSLNIDPLKIQEDLGVLLFAFDNEQIDYLSLAIECAERIKKYWDLPVSVVVSTTCTHPDHEQVFDNIIKVDAALLKKNMKMFLDYEKNLSFWNSNRVQALDLTPYRRTILVDVDFLVQTNNIPEMWDGSSVALTKKAYSVFDNQPLSTDMQALSHRSRLPMYWATVVCFNRESDLTKRFFSEWKKALANYRLYSFMYGFAEKPVRNDFAVTIAVYKMIDHDYRDHEFDLEYSIPSLMPTSKLVEMNDGALVAEHPDGTRVALYGDLHVMNKKSILTCRNQSFTKAF